MLRASQFGKSVFVPSLGREARTGESFYISKLAGRGQYFQLINVHTTSEPQGLAWKDEAKYEVVLAQWYAEVGDDTHLHPTSPWDAGDFYRCKGKRELILTHEISLIPVEVIEGIITVFHGSAVQAREV